MKKSASGKLPNLYEMGTQSHVPLRKTLKFVPVPIIWSSSPNPWRKISPTKALELKNKNKKVGEQSEEANIQDSDEPSL